MYELLEYVYMKRWTDSHNNDYTVTLIATTACVFTSIIQRSALLTDTITFPLSQHVCNDICGCLLSPMNS